MEGFAEQCQLILKANEGMDLNDFFQFLFAIGTPILRRFEEDASLVSEGARKRLRDSLEEELERFCPGSALHDLFDLSRISHCLGLMQADDDFQCGRDSLTEEEKESVPTLVCQIERVLERHLLS